jgi:catechol 2,3-dioxygenase-like lactoylglutathione lyase family enzyme
VGKAKLENAAAVLVTPDVRRTAAYYRDVFGFRVVEHYDADEAFAAVYRDNVEILLVQARHGEFAPNRVRFGAGFDLYLDPDTVEGVDAVYAELKAKGARVLHEPAVTPYGAYEFVVQDEDGRLIGIGHIRDRDRFFRGAVH